MATLMENFEKADLKCRGILGRDSQFMSLYPFATENISGYIDKFDLKGKSLLTVGSSGDQVINAGLKGAKDITFLDINPFIKYYYYLKVAGILSLNIEEFYLFFCYYNYPMRYTKNDNAFSRNLFCKLSRTLYDLDPESFQFWDRLFKNHEPSEVRRHLFCDDEEERRVIEKCNPYLSKHSYNEIREMIKDTHITFISQNILSANVNGLFDNIWLSNVSMRFSPDMILDMFNRMYPLLNENGQLLFYVYGPTDSTKNTHMGVLKEILDSYQMTISYFQGVNDFKLNDGTKDYALIIKKH